jgi:hypothetical protein
MISLIFEISDHMLSNWISFLAYPNLFDIKDFVVVLCLMIKSFMSEVDNFALMWRYLSSVRRKLVGTKGRNE